VIRIEEVGLFVGFFIHIIQGLVLIFQNRKKRDIPYAVHYGNEGSTWYSRSMGLLGTLLLLFLIMHIYHFWTPSRLGGIANIHELETIDYDGKEYHNLFAEMVKVFQNPVIVGLYVLGCASLAYHLLHGFQSAFRTLGMGNSRYVKMVQSLGTWFSIIVPIAFAMMPVSIYLGWVS